MLRIVILLLLVGQLGRIPVISTGTSEAPLLVNDICVLALIAVTFISALAAESFRIDSVGGLMLAFATIGFASALLGISRFGLSGVEVIVSLAYLARWFAYFTVYLVVINIVRGDDVMDVWRSLETMMLIFSVFGIIQSIFLPRFAQLVYPDSRVFVDWDDQGHRLVSTMLEPNIAGSMIMLVLLVNVAQLAAGERVAFWKPLIFLAALVASLSRSSFLGLAVGLTVVLAVRGISRRMLRFGMVVGVVVLAALPKIIEYAMRFNKLTISDASAMSRVINWLRALRIWADYPVFGIGFNTFGFIVERYGGIRAGSASYSSDGGLLFIAVMTGVVGLALYVAMLVLVFRTCRRVWRDVDCPASWRALAVGIGAGVPAIIVHATFVNSILTPFVMEMLWVLWGLAFVMSRSVKRVRASAAASRLVACGSIS
jgi:O-antigen ligase